MGLLSSKFQFPPPGPEEATEGMASIRRRGCECKKRKRNSPCDCESEQEEEDDILDTPRRQVNSKIVFHCQLLKANIHASVKFACFSFFSFFFLSRKKLKSTSKYIYQTLFLNGENSDIRISALGQEWNLHKVYLCQVI